MDGKGHVADTTTNTDKVRTTAARVVWGIFLVFGLVLAVRRPADRPRGQPGQRAGQLRARLRQGDRPRIFDLDNPIREFTGENADIKEALLN